MSKTKELYALIGEIRDCYPLDACYSPLSVGFGFNAGKPDGARIMRDAQGYAYEKQLEIAALLGNEVVAERLHESIRQNNHAIGAALGILNV